MANVRMVAMSRPRPKLDKIKQLMPISANTKDLRRIASEVGCTLSLVFQARKEMGLPKMPRKLDEVKKLIQPDMGITDLKQIAKSVGCCMSLIWALRKSMGMPMFPRGGRRRWTDPARIDTARRLKMSGWTYVQIGKQMGVSPSAIQAYLRVPGDRNGICENCGNPFPSLHGHHLDYAEDSKSQLLCPGCHSRAHQFLHKYRTQLKMPHDGIDPSYYHI